MIWILCLIANVQKEVVGQFEFSPILSDYFLFLNLMKSRNLSPNGMFLSKNIWASFKELVSLTHSPRPLEKILPTYIQKWNENEIILALECHECYYFRKLLPEVFYFVLYEWVTNKSSIFF